MSNGFRIPTHRPLFVGEDRTLPMTITDPAGAPANIAGWALSWMLKRLRSDATGLIVLTTGAGIVLTDPTVGELEVRIPSAQTNTLVDLVDWPTVKLATVVCWHELKRTDPGSEAILGQDLIPVRLALHRPEDT